MYNVKSRVFTYSTSVFEEKKAGERCNMIIRHMYIEHNFTVAESKWIRSSHVEKKNKFVALLLFKCCFSWLISLFLRHPLFHFNLSSKIKSTERVDLSAKESTNEKWNKQQCQCSSDTKEYKEKPGSVLLGRV